MVELSDYRSGLLNYNNLPTLDLHGEIVDISKVRIRDFINDNYKFNIKMPEKSEPYVVDYCGANGAKPLHVGHMRTTIVGESIARIIRFMDQKTICDVHLGDYGLQIGQVIYGILRDKKTIEEIDITYLDKLYPEISGLCKEDENLKKQCAEITKKLQDGDLEYTKIWKKVLEIKKEYFHFYGY